MVLEALLYILGIGMGVNIVLQTRQLGFVKRWHDVSFLQGMGMIAWGIGNLLAVHPLQWVQSLSLPISLLYYLFFLLSLHRFPLASHLYYERWKTALDTLTLVAVYEVIAISLWMAPDQSEILPVIMQLQCGLFLLIPAMTVLVANRQLQGPEQDEREKLVITMMWFIAVTMLKPFFSPYAIFLAGLTMILCLSVAHDRFGQYRGKKERVKAKYRYLHEKLIFAQWDANMVQVLLFLTAVAMIAIPQIPSIGMVGLGLGILLGGVRSYMTSRANSLLMKDAFQSASGLEHKSLFLRLKQNYEHLLISNNEQSLRAVTYETLQQIIEELVDTWFAQIDSLVYLRLSLESEQGIEYNVSERGTLNHEDVRHRVNEKIVVDEQRDTALTPRYVTLVAHTTAVETAQKELEQSFFQLLLVNVRGLILRSLHDQQSIELRMMEKEMELARRIQSLLIPKEQLTLKGLCARAVYSPVTYVGGDYLDYIRIDERYTCFIVADVSGHGLPASLLATGMRSAVRAVLQKSWSPDEILGRLNQLLYEDLSKTRSFITMLVAVYDGDEHKLLLSRAGHPQPLYLSATKKTVLRCGGGVGLGLLPDSAYKLEEVPLREDGILLVYTDGLLETGRKEMPFLLQKWLHDLSLLLDKQQETTEDPIDRVEKYLWEMTRKGQQTDDISVLILQFESGLENRPMSIGI